MSPHINSLVGDLVAMAQAMEKVPHLEDQINAMRSQLEASQSHNQGLETNIISYKQQIEDLNAKVRSLEVERDDASFRVLEAEDHAAANLVRARTIQNTLEGMIALLDPPEPQPEPEVLQPQAVELSKDQSVDHPIQSQSTPTTGPVNTSSEEAPKSDVNPNNSLSGSSQDTHGGGEASKGHYFGKRYHDYHAYVSLHDWLDGGGTEEDYYWRPERKTSF